MKLDDSRRTMRSTASESGTQTPSPIPMQPESSRTSIKMVEMFSFTPCAHT